MVAAGEHDLNNNSDTATRHRVKYVHQHPLYYRNERYIRYDFSLIELEDPIWLDVDSRARAACLPSPEDNGFDEETRFVVSGWGIDQSYNGSFYNSSQPSKLKSATVEYCSADHTSSSYCELCPPWDWNFCTRATGVEGPCAGDNGGRA